MTNFETKYERHYRTAVNLFGKTESLDDVLRYIDSIAGNDGDVRNGTLERFACFLASQQKANDALQFCAAISDPLEKANALLRAAVELRKQNLVESAKAFLNKSIESAEGEHSYETAMIFLQIAGLFERLGEDKLASDLLDRAIRLAEPKPQDFEAGKTLRGCARLLASWNRVTEAIEVAQMIELPELRTSALEEVQGRGQWPVFPGVRLD